MSLQQRRQCLFTAYSNLNVLRWNLSAPFFYPLEISENLRFSDVFRGSERCIGNAWVNVNPAKVCNNDQDCDYTNHRKHKIYLVISFLSERSNLHRQTDGHKNWDREREAQCLHDHHKKAKSAIQIRSQTKVKRI